MDRPRGRVIWGQVAAGLLLAAAAAALWTTWSAVRNEPARRLATCFAPETLPAIDTQSIPGRSVMHLRILLWNVEGLPWPGRTSRQADLNRMTRWLAARRAAGKGPDILILHEAFTKTARRIVLAGRYRSILAGPSRDEKRQSPAAASPPVPRSGPNWFGGEGLGKWVGSGLYVATDLPVIAQMREAFGESSCAGFDCLANKGAHWAAVAVPGAPGLLAIFNTHRNALTASGAKPRHAEDAHVRQTRENDALLAHIPDETALIAAGDFDDYRAGDRIGRFAADPRFRLVVPAPRYRARSAPMQDVAAWESATDLLGYRSSKTLEIEPVAMASLFDGKNGPRLSDHDAQYIVMRLSWRSDAKAAPFSIPPCPASRKS